MVEKTAAEWKAELTPEQYRVLRRKGTQASGTGEYDNFFVSTALFCNLLFL
jgi:peptide-methionine (R)-S-oxide reductase